MEIKVKFTLNIGQSQSRVEHDILEVEEAWLDCTQEEKDEVLHYHWKSWAWNYIDGSCSEEDGE